MQPPEEREEADHATLHSVAHPGSGPHSSWDERRILHLEGELDRLSARVRLLDKALAAQDGRLRIGLWVLGIGIILLLLVARR